MTWTKGLLACIVALPIIACTVSVTDDPIGNQGGEGGDAGSAGSATAQGGGGNGGDGQGGSSGSAGSGGSAQFPEPVCTAESGDDECITCLKQQCCDAWRGCNDFGCDEEWNGITLCVSDFYTEMQYADEEELGMCISENSIDESGFAQMNTNAVIDCINEIPETDAGGGTRCGVPCFGTDIFLE